MKLIRYVLIPAVTFWMGGVSIFLTMLHSQIGMLPPLQSEVAYEIAVWPWTVLLYVLGF
jgi:hypothetical protein